jgi:hypothetical protein
MVLTPSKIQEVKRMSQSSDTHEPSPSAEERLQKVMYKWQGGAWYMKTDSGIYQDLKDEIRAAEQAAREPLLDRIAQLEGEKTLWRNGEQRIAELEREVERLRVAGELLAQPHEDLIASLVDAELHAPGQGWTREDGEEFFGKEGIRECEEFYERKMREQLNLHIEGAHETAVAHDKALEAARAEGKREALIEVKSAATVIEIGAMLICGSPDTNIDGMRATAKSIVDQAAAIRALED